MVQCSALGPLHQLIDDFLDASLLKIVSTLSIIFPLGWSGARLKSSGYFGKVFFCFLLLGLVADVLGWCVNALRPANEFIHVFNSYALAEALFFFWLVRSLSTASALRRLSFFFLVCAPVSWLVVLAWPVFKTGKLGQIMPFIVAYEVIISFLAGFGLLELAEKETHLLYSWRFWFLMGVFFYCFCTFFVMAFLGKELLFSLWPINNMINILTYLFYCLGWWRYGQPRQQPMA